VARIDAQTDKSGGSGDISLLTMECTYGTLLFRYDLKLSFFQVNNFAVALIINFSFQGAMPFFDLPRVAGELASRPRDSWIGVVRTEPFLVISSGTLLSEWLSEPGR
jgi:hypothetical protein